MPCILLSFYSVHSILNIYFKLHSEKKKSIIERGPGGTCCPIKIEHIQIPGNSVAYALLIL
jgi:hypothetical protein